MANATNVPAAAGRPITDLQLGDAERTTGGGGYAKAIGWLVLLGGAAFAVYCYRQNPNLLQELRGAEFDAASVIVKGAETVALELTGYVVPYRKVNVSPRIPGLIVKLTIDVGQQVKQGELLAQLDDASYQADLQQAQAMLKASISRSEELKNGAQPEEVAQVQASIDAAKSKLELVTAELQRAYAVNDTPSSIDQLASTKKEATANKNSLEAKLQLLTKPARPERVRALEADVEQSESLVAKARYYLDNTRIVAPIEGIVLEKNAQVGEILRPEVLSTSLCILADLSIMEVEIDVQERDFSKIEIGRVCQIIPDAYPDRKYLGKIDRFQPMVSRSRGVVRVTIRIDEPDKYLLPEMNVRAIVEKPSGDAPATESLWIPEAAVLRNGPKAAVFVLQDNHARWKDVTLGGSEGKRVEVTAGLDPKDVVLLPGGKPLTDGQAVRRKSGK